jgi:capsular exopolysaccharide synthesis family protein
VLTALNLLNDPEFIGATDPEGKILSMISVSSPKESNVVVVFVTGRDPLKITNIANTWAREFVNADIDQRIKIVKYGISWMGEQIEDTLKKLQLAEKKLNDFIRDNQIVEIPDVGQKQESLIKTLQTEKANLEKDITEASKQYGEKHPKMIALKAQLEAVDKQLQEERDRLFALQDKALEYKILRRDVDNYKSLYDSLLVRHKQLELTKEVVDSNIQLLDKAVVPQSPIRPQPQRDIIHAIILSLGLGVGFCFFLEYTDATLKTSDDVEFYVKMPFLGYTPTAKKEIRHEKDGYLLTNIKPHSMAAEAFRNLRVSLLFSFPEDKPLHTLLITSSIAGEGKTFLTSNLAITFAQSEDTLLVDADMRRGRLAKAFEIQTRNGLSSVLAGASTLEETVIATAIPHLSLLPCGPYTPNPTELLSSEKLGSVFDKLKNKFKKIIIDSTPVLSVSDAIILGDRCDGLVFIIRAGFTTLKCIVEAKKILEKKVKIVGAVLNNIDIEGERHYYYYHYYDYLPEKKA